MKKVALTQGKFALVDDQDFDQVNQLNWFAHLEKRTWYAMRNVSVKEGRGPGRYVQYMHAFILNTPPGLETLHLNGNGLDNQRHNLKAGTTADNRKSRTKLKRRHTTGFRGVGIHKSTGKIRAFIAINRRHQHLGYFSTLEEAARVRDAKARELGWPEEGMNFPKESRP